MMRTAFLLVFLLAPAIAKAQSPIPFPLPLPFDTRGTPEDQRACRNDAVKLCRPVLGDDSAVLRCFQSQRSKLSRPCAAVLAKYGV